MPRLRGSLIREGFFCGKHSHATELAPVPCFYTLAMQVYYILFFLKKHNEYSAEKGIYILAPQQATFRRHHRRWNTDCWRAADSTPVPEPMR